jgi:hypothetical protein
MKHTLTIGDVTMVSKDIAALNHIFNLVGPHFTNEERAKAILESSIDGVTVREIIERDLVDPRHRQAALDKLNLIDKG